MRRGWLLVGLMALTARADVGAPKPDAATILARVLAGRVLKDFSLKARLFVTRDRVVPVDVLVRNTATETRTLYRSGSTALLVVQPVRGEPRFFFRGTGELTGALRMGRLLGSEFGYYDLGLPFLQWQEVKLIGEDRVREQDCYVIEAKATGQPYARAKLWIHQQYYALLRAEAYDDNDNLVKRFAISSFKKIGDVWIPRGIEIASVPRQQALPSETKSRLEIFEGNYDTNARAEQFDEHQFGGPAPD